jgi:pyrroline-5-carboxylate reductase
MIQLLGVVGSLAQTFLEGKVEKQKAKSKIMQTAADNDSRWEMIMAESTKGSWRDELITVVVLLPCVLSFVPGMEEIVQAGFDRLNELPQWYQNVLYVTILAGLGLKGVDKFRKK